MDPPQVSSSSSPLLLHHPGLMILWVPIRSLRTTIVKWQRMLRCYWRNLAQSVLQLLSLVHCRNIWGRGGWRSSTPILYFRGLFLRWKKCLNVKAANLYLYSWGKRHECSCSGLTSRLSERLMKCQAHISATLPPLSMFRFIALFLSYLQSCVFACHINILQFFNIMELYINTFQVVISRLASVLCCGILTA